MLNAEDAEDTEFAENTEGFNPNYLFSAFSAPLRFRLLYMF